MIVDVAIPTALDGERVDRIVALLTECTRSTASAWIRDGRVSVDDHVVTSRSRPLSAGSRIRVEMPDPSDDRPRPDPTVTFEVVHADDQVVVVDKPPGLVVHPGSGHPEGTLVNGLLARFPELAEVGQVERPGIVHRLDRGTSGLLVVARTPHAYTSLVADLAAHKVERRYDAVVIGRPEPARGVIDAPVGRSARHPTRMAVTAAGRMARTHYEVRTTFEVPLEVSRVECRLETGRTHQIRVHLAAISHPVLGDATYGGARPELAMDRPFLHAHTLGFIHPGTGERVAFSAPLAADLAAVLARLEGPASPQHRDRDDP